VAKQVADDVRHQDPTMPSYGAGLYLSSQPQISGNV
jgi:hypothetical protein